MAITGSPAVIVQEQDLSSFVSADSVTTGAVVGAFEWGPVEAITKITSEGKLIQFFGTPHDWNYKDWFTARNFLNYSSSLAVVRAVNRYSKNASDNGADILQKNYETLEFDLVDKTSNSVHIPGIISKKSFVIARYPGDMGNNIRVCLLNKLGIEEQNTILVNDKDAPKNGASEFITRPLSNDEIAVAIFVNDEVQEYGIFSTVDGSTDVTGYGNYIFKYFNNNSNWVYFIKENLKFYDEEGNPIAIRKDLVLNGGLTPSMDSDIYLQIKLDEKHSSTDKDVIEEWKNGPTTVEDLRKPENAHYLQTLTDEFNQENLSSIYDGWRLFANEETEDAEVQLLMQGGGSLEVGQHIIDLAKTRKDCLACVSPMLEEVVNTLTPVDNIRKGSGSYYEGSSYAFMDGNYKYQYDNYNDVYRWIPLNGDIAGIMAQLDAEEDPWMSPGGKQIKNCVKLAFHPTKADRDILFSYNVNPVTNFRAEGNILWGDWTRVENTAFNFVGVRRLFLYVERAIKDYARNVMWKQNDEITETIFIQTVEPFLNNIVGGRGIQEFKVAAGAKVTSPEEMDKGIFRAKIIIKPVRSIRYVVLVFTAVRSDMSIEEIVQ